MIKVFGVILVVAALLLGAFGIALSTGPAGAEGGGSAGGPALVIAVALLAVGVGMIAWTKPPNGD